MAADRLQSFVSERNAKLATDAAIQGGMGLGFSLVTFGGFWWIAWLLFGSFREGLTAPVPLAITAVYVAVATWSAWRGVDPYDNLLPLTRAEANRREVEARVKDLVGGTGLEGLARREGIAGCAQWLLAGPQGVIKGVRTWSKRVTPDPALLSAAQSLLDAAATTPPPIGEDPRASLLLVHLGLARLDADPEGIVRVFPTAKGKRVVDPAG